MMSQPITPIVDVPDLPIPRGPFAQGVIAQGPFLFVAGQGPWEPVQQSFSRGSIAEQTELTLRCIARVAERAGAGIENIVSCRVYLQPLNETTFAEMNAAYARFFKDHRPARTTIGCSLLKIDVEIDAVIQLP